MSPVEESNSEGASGETEGVRSSSEGTSGGPSSTTNEFSVKPADLTATDTTSAVTKTSEQQEAATAQKKPETYKPITTSTDPTPTEASATAKEFEQSIQLTAKPADVTFTQTSTAVPKESAQQQTAPTQGNPAIPKPSSIPATSTASTTDNQPKAEGTLTQASTAVPKASAQQQTAPTQGNPAIPKPSSIPATPTPKQEPDKGDKAKERALLAEKVRNLFKLSTWFKPNNQANQLQQVRQLAVLVAWLIALVIFVRVYGGILLIIESVPLAPSLFEMAGIIWLAWFSITRLIRSQDRQEVIFSVRSRWHAFSGSKQTPDSSN